MKQSDCHPELKKKQSPNSITESPLCLQRKAESHSAPDCLHVQENLSPTEKIQIYARRGWGQSNTHTEKVENFPQRALKEEQKSSSPTSSYFNLPPDVKFNEESLQRSEIFLNACKHIYDWLHVNLQEKQSEWQIKSSDQIKTEACRLSHKLKKKLDLCQNAGMEDNKSPYLSFLTPVHALWSYLNSISNNPKIAKDSLPKIMKRLKDAESGLKKLLK